MADACANSVSEQSDYTAPRVDRALPGSAQLGIEPGQWDSGWWVLKELKRVGLVSHVITSEKLEARKDLERINS